MIPPYQQARFRLSTPALQQLPADEGVEVAIVGRSNSGKSSVLNTLTGQTKLARISKTPGRTQHIVVFDLDETRRLIDLPGYGYAKVDQETQRQWGVLIEKYLSTRQCLKGLILLMDIRHPFKDTDLDLLAWCEHRGLPVHVLLNKSDKLSRGAASATWHKAKQQLKAEIFSCQTFSVLKKEGVATLLEQLDVWFAIERGNRKGPGIDRGQT